MTNRQEVPPYEFYLRHPARDYQALLSATAKHQARLRWPPLTPEVIIVPNDASHTSHPLPDIETLLAVPIPEWRYYTFMVLIGDKCGP